MALYPLSRRCRYGVGGHGHLDDVIIAEDHAPSAGCVAARQRALLDVVVHRELYSGVEPLEALGAA
eukprot:scaffold233595_cov26-Tisochrysis_lutea.AAC.2